LFRHNKLICPFSFVAFFEQRPLCDAQMCLFLCRCCKSTFTPIHAQKHGCKAEPASSSVRGSIAVRQRELDALKTSPQPDEAAKDVGSGYSSSLIIRTMFNCFSIIRPDSTLVRLRKLTAEKRVSSRNQSNLFVVSRSTLSIERSPFAAKNQTLTIVRSIYFAYQVDIISSYSNRISRSTVGTDS